MVNGLIILFGLTMLYLSTTSRLKAHVNTLVIQGLLLFLICATDFSNHPWQSIKSFSHPLIPSALYSMTFISSSFPSWLS